MDYDIAIPTLLNMCSFQCSEDSEIEEAAASSRSFPPSQLLIHLLRIARGIRVEAELWTDPNRNVLRAGKGRAEEVPGQWPCG